MQENISEKNISEKRLGSCALGGALSVSAFIPDAVTVIHSPNGCAHQQLSILHAMIYESELSVNPKIIVSGLLDKDVIFGGENSLRDAIDKAALEKPELIIVIPSCIPETIGDDCKSVCREHVYSDKIICIPASGFIGGTAQDGENMCLIGLSDIAETENPIPRTAAIIGEKNFETECDENYAEVCRLLKRLRITVTVRFCKNNNTETLKKLGTAEFFIQRDERCTAACRSIAEKFHRPYVKEFPRGLLGCIEFLRSAGHACHIPEDEINRAAEDEAEYQSVILKDYEKLRGKKINLGIEPFEGTFEIAREVMNRLGIIESADGTEIKLPFYLPTGAAGTLKMLNLWKRAVIYG